MLDINLIYNILNSEDISIYEEELFTLIPELKYEKDFEQRSKWHVYDVWHHTLETIKACDNKEDKLVMLLHDIGKPFSYQDDGDIRHFKGHAEKSYVMSKEILKRFNLSELENETILKLIRLHSTNINIEDINTDNKEFYKRLLKIKMCDAKGYEKEHSKMILKDLEKIRIKIN